MDYTGATKYRGCRDSTNPLCGLGVFAISAFFGG
jgi:hypothetical protein